MRPSWYRCAHSTVNRRDELAALRAGIRRLYGDPAIVTEFGLVDITLPVKIVGFDKLTLRLSYARILRQGGGDLPVTITTTGRVLGLLPGGADPHARLRELRADLIAVTPDHRLPRLAWQRLPPQLPEALQLLARLAG
ncbi:MAG: hypothetical protein ACRD0P_28235 [Stackebrandtia sp.]